jgi:hypothetical protein
VKSTAKKRVNGFMMKKRKYLESDFETMLSQFELRDQL